MNALSYMPQESLQEIIIWLPTNYIYEFAFTSKTFYEKTNQLVKNIFKLINAELNKNNIPQLTASRAIEYLVSISNLKNTILWTNMYLFSLKMQKGDISNGIRMPKFLKSAFRTQLTIQDAKTNPANLSIRYLENSRKVFYLADKLYEIKIFPIREEIATLQEEAIHWAHCGHWQQAFQSALGIQDLGIRWETFSIVINEFQNALGLDLNINLEKDVTLDQALIVICNALIECDRLLEASVLASHIGKLWTRELILKGKIFKTMIEKKRWDQLLGVFCKVVVNNPIIQKDLMEEKIFRSQGVESKSLCVLHNSHSDYINHFPTIEYTTVLQDTINQLADPDRLDEVIALFSSIIPTIDGMHHAILYGEFPELRIPFLLLSVGRFEDFYLFWNQFNDREVSGDLFDHLDSIALSILENLSTPLEEFLSQAQLAQEIQGENILIDKLIEHGQKLL